MALLERETKLELSEPGFEALLQAGRICRRVEQLNIYFDYRWRLAEHGATFRVRFDSTKAKRLTVKLPVRWGNYRVMEEFEEQLTHLKRRANREMHRKIRVPSVLPQEIVTKLAELDIETVERVGWVRNLRQYLEIPGVGILELDRLRLPNGNLCFEAEFEHDDRARHRQVSDYVDSLVNECEPSSLSKYQRLREAVG